MTRVWSQFRRWSRNGTWARALTVLHEAARQVDGRAETTPSMVVIDTKHAGLAPRQRQPGTYTGQTRLTGKGRPRLRAVAWRAVWGTLQTNPVYAGRYRHLTTREANNLKPAQAQAVITTGQAWDPAIAQHGTRPKQAAPLAA